MNKQLSKPSGILTPFSAKKRRAFAESFYPALRESAARDPFPYRNCGDARNPRPDAKRIKQALKTDLPLKILHDIEDGITLMMLAAGKCISVDVPLETQFLAASQHNADWHGGKVLGTPEELKRIGALHRANIIVLDALDAFDAWQKGEQT